MKHIVAINVMEHISLIEIIGIGATLIVAILATLTYFRKKSINEKLTLDIDLNTPFGAMIAERFGIKPSNHSDRRGNTQNLKTKVKPNKNRPKKKDISSKTVSSYQFGSDEYFLDLIECFEDDDGDDVTIQIKDTD